MDPLFELALSIKAGHRALERVTNDALAPLGLTALQADALSVIAETGEVSLRELGELLIAEAGHPSRLVDRLVAAGYVRRRPAERDRRRIVLSLTPRGRALCRRIDKVRAELRAVVEPLVTSRDVAATLRVFRKLLPLTGHADVLERRRAIADSASPVRG